MMVYLILRITLSLKHSLIGGLVNTKQLNVTHLYLHIKNLHVKNERPES